MNTTIKKQTKKPWTITHLKRYNALYNYITGTLKLNYNKDSYIKDHKNNIMKQIRM